MDTKAVTKFITRTCGTIGGKLNKYSPEILIVTGIVGTVAATVMACRATNKAHDILEKIQHDTDEAKECLNSKEVPEEMYTIKDYRKEVAGIYIRGTADLAKIYGPSLILGVTSVTMILAGHNITRKRNAALVAAYNAIDSSFRAYRQRVIEDAGEDKDKEYKYGTKKQSITVEEDGKKVKTKAEVLPADGLEGYSQYAKFFDDGCRGWNKDPEANLLFLKFQQNYANDKLHSRGYVFLNEVYDLLGIPRTQAGQVVGWVEGNGDDFIDFGIYDLIKEKNRDFINGYEPAILLDFNVDGVIIDKI